MKNMKIWKYSGIFLVATGILHTLVGMAMGKDELWGIVKDGFFNAAADDDLSRGVIFWFLICGIFLLILGHVVHYYIKKEQQPAPKLLGYWLLGLGIVGCAIMPASGFWLFLPQALIIIFAKQRNFKYEKR